MIKKYPRYNVAMKMKIDEDAPYFLERPVSTYKNAYPLSQDVACVVGLKSVELHIAHPSGLNRAKR